jgi:transposase InsO family protein
LKEDHSIHQLCKAFEVSASGYYRWKSGQSAPGPRQKQDQTLMEQIGSIHQKSRFTYGAPRIQVALRALGHRHGRNRISRLMRQKQLCGRQKRRYRVRTTESNHEQPIAPNRLAQLPPPSACDQVWVADITYIPITGKWCYLAAILDLYSRRIVGWALSEHNDTELVLAAWNMALCHREPPAGLIVHSDRGVQYASSQYREALKSAQAISSMSRKANCYDNATMEAFWSTLKLELVYRQPQGWFGSLQEARQALFDFIEVFYNRQRLHSAIGYHAPAQWEESAQN